MKDMKMKLISTTLLGLLFSAVTLFSQITTIIYDGFDNDYAGGSNRTPGAIGLDRPDDGSFYRWIDADATDGATVEYFALSGGMMSGTAGYTGPELYGGAAWRDNVRPDDSATKSGSILSVRNNPFDVQNSSAVRADSVRLYSLSDTTGGITPDEAFAAVLFEFNAGSNLQGISWTGSTSANLDSANIRFVVQEGSSVYVSESIYAIGDNGNGVETQSLNDINSTDWAIWNPNASDIRGMEVIAAELAFSSVTFSNVTKVGYYAEIADSVDATVYMDMAQFSVTAVPEPSTYALLLGMVTFVVILIRRRLRD